MATIGNLNYKIGADTSGLTQGMVATKRELREAGKLMESTRTPAERMGQQLDSLGNLYRKGAIDAETYRRRVAQIRAEKLAAVPVVGQFAARLTSLHPGLIAAGAGMAAFTAGTAAAVAVVRQLTEIVKTQLPELDKLAKTSARLGVEGQDLLGLRKAAGRFSGVSDDVMDAALLRMTRNLATAAAEGGKVQEALQQIGLDAAKLQEVGTKEAFLEIAGALQRIPDVGERARLSFAVLGRQGQELVGTFAEGRDAIEGIIEKQAELGGNLTEFDLAQIQQAVDALSDVQTILTGIAQRITVELAPNITAVSEMTVELLQNVRAVFGEVDQAAAQSTQSVGELTIWLAAAMDVAQTLYQTFQFVEKLGLHEGMSGVGRRVAENLTGARDTIGELQDAANHQGWGEAFIERVMEIRDAARQIRDLPAGLALDLDDEITDLVPEIDALDEAIKRFTESLEDQAYFSDLTREELALLKFEWAGATEEQLAAARAAYKLIEAQRQAADWQKQMDRQAARAEQITKSLRSPAEKLADDLAELQELFDAEAIDETTFVRALQKLRDEAAEPIVARVDVLGVESAEIGTQAAAKALARFRQQASEAAGEVNVNLGGRDVRADEAKDQREVLERIADLLQQIAGNTDEDPLQVREVTIP